MNPAPRGEKSTEKKNNIGYVLFLLIKMAAGLCDIKQISNIREIMKVNWTILIILNRNMHGKDWIM